MRKIILFAAVLFATTSMVMAQAANPDDLGGNAGNAGNVTLQLNLHAFQSIEIGGGEEGTLDGETGLVGGAVVLDYNTVEKYENGVKRTINDHIKIKSAGGYAVNVSTDVAAFSDGNTAGDIPINTIGLTATAKNDGGNAVIADEFKLSTTVAPFITSKKGSGKEVSFDVTYTGDNSNNYGQYVDATGNVRYLTATVTYQIVAQ